MLLASSNRKYPPFPLLSYFSVVVCLRCLLHHILLLIAYTFRENREFVFIIIVQFMMSANNRIRFVSKIVFICLYITPSHYHHCANLSEDVESINACQIYFVECVSKMRHILSVIHYTIRVAVCFQFTHFLMMIERIYIPCLIIIIKSEVWTITHCLGLGHWTMVCAVCPFVFLWERFNTLMTVYVPTTFSNALFKEDLCILFWISRKTLPKCAICYELSMARLR